MTGNKLLMISQLWTLGLRVCLCGCVSVRHGASDILWRLFAAQAVGHTQHVCPSPVRPAKLACSSSWPVAASAPPAGLLISAAHCPAAPATEAPPAPLAHVSDENRKENRDAAESGDAWLYLTPTLISQTTGSINK